MDAIVSCTTVTSVPAVGVGARSSILATCVGAEELVALVDVVVAVLPLPTTAAEARVPPEAVDAGASVLARSAATLVHG